MSHSSRDIDAAESAIEKYRAGDDTEVGAALAVVGLSAERAANATAMRDEMIRVAHRAGASLRQLAEVSGLDRKMVTAIAGAAAPSGARRARG